DGKMETRYVKLRANTLSLLFELGLARHRIQVHLQQLRAMANNLKTSDFDEVYHNFVTQEESLIQESYKVICTQMNNYYFCKKYKQKRYSYTSNYE
ncbi:hypothetical protein, partial [Glycocaulis alkaliphilus]